MWLAKYHDSEYCQLGVNTYISGIPTSLIERKACIVPCQLRPGITYDIAD